MRSPQRDEDRRPESPLRLGGRGWWQALKRTVRGIGGDNLTDWAAALTYYSVLSIFPGLLALTSILGLVGQSVTRPLLDNLGRLAPGAARQILTGAAHGIQRGHGSLAGVLTVVGVAAAIWSASGYVGAFMRAANAIWDVPEGRPVWKKLPTRLAITIAVGVLLAVSALIVVFTGRLAQRVGALIGVGDAAVSVWSIVKWPVLVALIGLALALLYWGAPNARQGGWRWISPGSLLAIIAWLAASAGFAVYVANFSSYNKTYGTLGGVIIFLVWLWISNLAVLVGAEFDAELQRGRAIAAGHPPTQEPYLTPRDTSGITHDDGGTG